MTKRGIVLMSLVALILGISFFYFFKNKEVGIVELLSSGKTLPENFNELTDDVPAPSVVVERVKNQKVYVETWSSFKIIDRLPNVNLSTHDVLFIGVQESSSCPYYLVDSKVDDRKKELVVYLMDKSRFGCNTDATPRNYVVKLEKEVSNQIKAVTVVFQTNLRESRQTVEIRDLE